MQDLRLVLIILGFIAIVALIAHGLWSNKKNQVKPLKDKPLGKVDNNVKDKQGFDLDGIGEKRVVSAPVEPTPMAVEKIEPQFTATADVTKSSEKESILTGSFSATDVDEATTRVHASANNEAINDVSYDVVEAELKPATSQTPEPIQAPEHTVVPAANEYESANDAVEEPIVTENTEKSAEVASDEAVFVINIMAREGKNIVGAELLQELSAFGFKFGAMNIFHRHVDAAGKGPVIFSLANMVKPGVFDIDTMEQFTSPGVSLFMMFPCAGQASQNYSLMLSAAERIAEGVDGLLMDASRNPLTEDAIEQEQAFIRKLESKALAK